MIDKWQHQDHIHNAVLVGVFIVLAGIISLYELAAAHIEIISGGAVKILSCFVIRHRLKQVILISLIYMLHVEPSILSCGCTG